MGTGDRAYGEHRQRRRWLEAQPQAYVLAVSGKASVGLGAPQRQMNTRLASWPVAGGTRLRCGRRGDRPRWDDWRGVSLADPVDSTPVDSTGRRGWLVRRSLSAPADLTASVVLAPQPTMLEEVVRVAGSRWTVASSIEVAKGEVGLAQYAVRSGTAWYRPITLAMWALALLTVMRAGTIAVARFKTRLPSPHAGKPAGGV